MSLISELGIRGGWRKGSAAAGLAPGSLLSKLILAIVQGQGQETPLPAPGTQGYPPMDALGTWWSPNLCVLE